MCECLRFDPVSILFNKFDEMLYGLIFGYIFFYAGFTFVQTDAVASCSYVTIVGVGHLSRSVDDAAHNSYLQRFEVRCCRFDTGDGLCQVKECATATGTRDVFGFTRALAGCLQDAIHTSQNFLGRDISGVA